VEDLAIQDQLEGNLCFGCGTLNPSGLQIKSYYRNSECLCTFHPKPEHAAGPPHILNGGILATIVDCHGVCTAIAAAYEAENRAIGSAPPLWYVTGSLSIDYLLPTPIGKPLLLRARIRESKGRKSVVEVEATSAAKLVAQATVLAVRVPLSFLSEPSERSER
jgi:acyl-coenzyme A thioesterase PaaI-like protein